jgi:hypothetical protein
MFPALPLGDRVANLIGAQGGTPDEDAMLNGGLLYYAPHGTANFGVNSTYAAGIDGVPVRCFHKCFAGVDAAVAHRYGQSPDTPPMNECSGWLLAKALGWPYNLLVPSCVLRELNGDRGSLCMGIEGKPGDPAPLAGGHPQGLAAAFFDSLIAQQDRHAENYRWEVAISRLHLIDQGYAFARPGDTCNSSVFVDMRWRSGQAALTAEERISLDALIASANLFDLAAILEAPRADCLAVRAQEMLRRGEILQVGEF